MTTGTTTWRRTLRVENLESRHLMATVAGIVFNDINGNGAQDAGDPILATLPALQNLQVGLVSPAAEATGRWQNTNNNYQSFETGPSGGVNTVLNFGVQFVAYSTFQPIGSEPIAGDSIAICLGPTLSGHAQACLC